MPAVEREENVDEEKQKPDEGGPDKAKSHQEVHLHLSVDSSASWEVKSELG